jgi:2,4-dienoyl-CoA reductase-like NADH-dependent reductase (Old Yellow Enzyme family)
MSKLIDPLSFAGLILRNRIAMPPMWSGKASPEGFVTGAIVEYHRVRAAAGCGLVIVEHAFVHPQGRHSSTQLGVHGDACVDGLTRLASAIRAEGAVACLQISHAGSRTSSKVTGGLRPLGPSALRHPREPHGEVPEAATLGQIAAVASAFADAASRAQHAGFEAVELHAAHGFLLSQFLSPLTNHRDDGFGGDEVRRGRAPLDVLAAVRHLVGASLPVFVRLGAHDEYPGGLQLDAACRMAARLAAAGAALIDVSGGLAGSDDPGRGPGYFVPYAAAIKKAVTVPVMVAGGIAVAAHADSIVTEGHADLVGVGRAMLDDPEWARKAIQALG